MAYQVWSVVFGEQPSASKWNILGTNDAGFNDGTAIGDDAIITRHMLDGNVTAPKLDADAIAHGFLEIGRTTLGSAADVITVSSLPARKYLLIIASLIPSGNITASLRFNNDSGNNYAQRTSANGAADVTAGNQSSMSVLNSPTYAYLVYLFTNEEAQEKIGELIVNNLRVTAGAANAPSRQEGVFKWANTASQVTRVDMVNSGTGDYASGSELIIMGKD